MSKTLSQKQAKSLAVVYAAWRGANADNDIVGRIVWGKMLLKKQHDTGIDLISTNLLKNIIDGAKRAEGKSL